jgi:hypothetical protein
MHIRSMIHAHENQNVLLEPNTRSLSFRFVSLPANQGSMLRGGGWLGVDLLMQENGLVLRSRPSSRNVQQPRALLQLAASLVRGGVVPDSG